MAQNLVTSQHPSCNLMWKWFLLTIIAFGIQCGALSEQDRQSQKAGIPEGCAHLISEVEVRNSSLQMQSPPIKQHRRSRQSNFEDFQGLHEALQLDLGTFTGQEGTFNGSGDAKTQTAQVFLWNNISRTVHNEVFFVTIFLELSVLLPFEEINSTTEPISFRSNVNMVALIQGAFSNRTGRFCATFCAGRSAEERRRPTNDRFYQFWSPDDYITPAEFAYMVEHPESNNVPRTLEQRDCDIHIELEIPKVRTIANPLGSGVMTSLRSPDDPLFFHPLNISGMSSAPYAYNATVQEEAHVLGARAISDISSGVRENLKLWSKDPPFCDKVQKSYTEIALPVWNSSCSSRKGHLCSPFQSLNISRIVSSNIVFKDIQCTSDWKVRAVFYFQFTQQVLPRSMANTSGTSFRVDFSLFAEGYWDFYHSGQLVMVAHYLAKDGSPLDTRIQITLQIPMARTLHHRYGIIGHIRSTREESDPLYFLSFSFLGNTLKPSIWRDWGHNAPEIDNWSSFRFSYDYDSNIKSIIQPVCSQAAESVFKQSNKNARFPDGSRASDLEVQISVAIPEIGHRSRGWGSTNLQILAIRQNFLDIYNREDPPRFSNAADPREIPVSFRGYTFADQQLETEGYYDSTTGHLCMLGCRRPWKDLAAPYEDGMGDNKSLNESCDLVFSIQYPPTNPRLWAKRPFVTGIISSLHDAHHPLYFKPVNFSSSETRMYVVQRRWTVLRRNMETIMSLATLSLTTFFIAIQVGYSTRQSSFKDLKFMSFVMLTVLTSGHIFPLLLSFNASWSKTVPAHVWTSYGPYGRLSGFSGWPEAHEVIVRGTGLAALLLELRLMQLLWRSRTRANSTPPHMVTENYPPSKVSDGSVLRACLPAYATLMVVVGYVHWQLGPHQEQVHYLGASIIMASVWADLQGISGVIVDLFLFPQVVANVLWDTGKKVVPLYPLFYMGVTAVRSVAHLFDVARVWNFISELDKGEYYYANPNWDLYSTTWDIVIPCCSIVLAIILFLQQRFGGRCLVPKRYRRQNYQPVGFLPEDL